MHGWPVVFVLVVEVDAGGGHDDEDRCGDQVDAALDGQDDRPAVRPTAKPM